MYLQRKDYGVQSRLIRRVTDSSDTCSVIGQNGETRRKDLVGYHQCENGRVVGNWIRTTAATMQ